MQSILQMFAQPQFLLITLVTSCTSAVYGLITIWTACGRWYWPFRTLTLWVAILLLVPIGAGDVASFFLLATPLIVLAVLAANWLRPIEASGTKRARSFTFRVTDLLLAMVVVAVWLTTFSMLAVAVPVSNRSSLIAHAALAVTGGLVVAVTYRIVLGPWRFGMTALALGIIAGAAIVLPRLVSWLGPWHNLQTIAVIAYWLTGFALLIGLFSALVRYGWDGKVLSSGRYVARAATWVLVAVFGLPLAWLFAQLAWVPSLPAQPLDAPNHFNRLVAYFRLEPGVTRSQPVAHRDVGDIAEEAAALLEAPNFVVLMSPGEYRHVSPNRRREHYEVAQALSQLASFLEQESKRASEQKRHDRAARCAVAVVRLGAMYRRGGLVDDMMSSDLLIQHGEALIVDMREQIPPSDARHIGKLLRRTFSEADDWATVVDRELAYRQQAMGWSERLDEVLRVVLGKSPAYPQRPPVNEHGIHLETVSELIQADLAIRDFRSEHGRLPDKLEDLVPAFLPQLPRDLYGGGPLIYRRKESDFELYSVGRDTVDNGGKFDSTLYYNVSGIDLDLTMVKPRGRWSRRGISGP
jgi:hypothetical protein